MCVWIWVASSSGRGGEPEAVDRPAQVRRAVGAAQRQPLAQRRLVDLDHGGAGALQVEHLVADRERDLGADRLGRGWSSRTNDHCRIVTGPVSIPFTGRSVSALGVPPPAHGHRLRPGDVAVEDRRLARSGCRRTAPSPCSVDGEAASCSAKYSTMSLRSGSPCTSTSRPSRSWRAIASRDLGLQEATRSPPGSGAPSRSRRRAARISGGLRERADRRRRQRRQAEPLRLPAGALGRRRAPGAVRRRGSAPGALAHLRVGQPAPTRRRAASARAARPSRRVALGRAGGEGGLEPRQLLELLGGEGEPAPQLGIEPALALGAVGDVQQRARRRQPQALGAEPVERRFDPVERSPRGRLRQTLRPSTTPSDSRASPPTAASAGSSCSGARTRSRWSSSAGSRRTRSSASPSPPK